MSKLKYATDLDGCIINFCEGFYEWFGEPYVECPTWNDPFINDNFHKIIDDESFWMSLKPLCKPSDILFDISMYITARPISSEVTHRWLMKHGFQDAPVITVGTKPCGNHNSKIQVVIDNNIDIMLEDAPHHFEELSEYTLCFLMDTKYNQHIYTPNRITHINQIKRWKRQDLLV